MEFRFIRHSDGRVFRFDPVAGTIGTYVSDPADIQGDIFQGADNPYGGGGPEVIQAHLDAAIDAALGDAGIASAGEQPLAVAWQLFHKQEPTYAFADAIRVLEITLRQTLGHPLTLSNGQLPTLHDLIEMAVGKGHIRREQRQRLNFLRVQRNHVMHGTLQLKQPRVRAELEFLEQVIAQLCH